MQQIRVEADERLPRIELEKLSELQGDLKSLSTENYDKLRSSIVNRGFFVPVFVWNNGKESKLLDGHQRLRVLKTLKDEGFTVPKIPFVSINAKSEVDAKEKLLAITSAYGKIEKDGLYEFIQGLNENMVVTDFQLPNIDALKFMDEFFNDELMQPLPPAPGDLKSVGGNGVKMLQLFFTEEDHGTVLSLIKKCQEKFDTDNATETVLRALEECAK